LRYEAHLRGLPQPAQVVILAIRVPTG